MHSIATLTKRTLEVSPAKQHRRSPLTVLQTKKKDSGGRVRRPSEKVRHAVHEHEETAQWRNAKAQKEREHRRRHHLMEEGSKNEDEENSEEGRDIDDDDDDDEEEEEDGTQVPPIFFFLCAILTEYHVKFSSHPVPSKLSAVPRQRPLTYSNSKVPKVAGGSNPEVSIV